MEANILPDANELWKGIAGYFDSLSHVLSEFIDNSISNFHANNSALRSVQITLDEINNDYIQISIEDSGTGIKELKNCLTLGDKNFQETPLNEHGFGIKHALASANPTNDNWLILTRTEEEFSAGKYRKVLAPYDFTINIEETDIKNEKWPGVFNGSGTYIQFNCSKILFNTIQMGIKGIAGFDRCLDYLVEELGYIYAGIISDGGVTIFVRRKSEKRNTIVRSVLPEWVDFYKPGSGSINSCLNENGSFTTIDYEFGEMRKSNKYFRHYQRNMSTSGVEIRINGRLIMDNVFTEIWGLEKHNSYNHFLVKINLKGDNLSCLPKTRTSKNSIRPDDIVLNNLFSWIRKTCPEPHEKLSSKATEDELVEELKESFETYIKDSTKHIEREFKVFRNISSPLPMDLYVYDGKQVRLYEAKKDKADVQAVYQLIMYWDGLVSDGQDPDLGVIIASEYSAGVDEIIDKFNNRKDEKGNYYHIEKTTWRNERVQYPE